MFSLRFALVDLRITKYKWTFVHLIERLPDDISHSAQARELTLIHINMLIIILMHINNNMHINLLNMLNHLFFIYVSTIELKFKKKQLHGWIFWGADRDEHLNWKFYIYMHMCIFFVAVDWKITYFLNFI